MGGVFLCMLSEDMTNWVGFGMRTESERLVMLTSDLNHLKQISNVEFNKIQSSSGEKAFNEGPYKKDSGAE